MDSLVLEKTLGTDLYNCLNSYVEENCNDPWQFFTYIEEFYPYTEMDVKYFFEILDEYSKKDPDFSTDIEDLAYNEEVYDLINGNVVFDTIWSINCDEILIESLKFNEFIQAYILPQYIDNEVYGNKDIFDFWNEYGGLSKEEIIESFTRYDTNIRIDKSCGDVYICRDL